MDDAERRRAALAFALIADMAGDGASTMESIRELALKHMRELRGPPTWQQIRNAALRWCGEKDRETFQSDITYFENNWQALPGLRACVERECT